VKILDSDHWIALLRGILDRRGRAAADEELAITAISAGELVCGAERSARPAEKLLERKSAQRSRTGSHASMR
jgi:predicted nucleic acid-binding protein